MHAHYTTHYTTTPQRCASHTFTHYVQRNKTYTPQFDTPPVDTPHRVGDTGWVKGSYLGHESEDVCNVALVCGEVPLRETVKAEDDELVVADEAGDEVHEDETRVEVVRRLRRWGETHDVLEHVL